MTVDRILILRAGALGDVILALPAVQALRSRYPDATLTVVGYPDNWRVAGSLVDTSADINSPTFAGLYSGAVSPDLRRVLGGVDLAVAWTVRDARPVLEAAGAREVVQASPYPPPGVHAAAWLVDTLGDHGVPIPDLHAWRLPLDFQERDRGRAVLSGMGMKRPALIHPGAGAHWKRWPPARFALLGEELIQRGYQVAVVEGPADAATVAEMQVVAASPFPVLPDLSLRDLAAVLAESALFIGNDSGVTHLAAVAGAPTVALFGPTDPASWSPLGAARLLRVCSAQATEQGQLRVCDDPVCLEAITVDAVARATSALSGLFDRD